MKIGVGTVLGRMKPGALAELGGRMPHVAGALMPELFGVGARARMECVVYLAGGDGATEARKRAGVAHADEAGNLLVVLPAPVALAVRKGDLELEFEVVRAGFEPEREALAA